VEPGTTSEVCKLPLYFFGLVKIVLGWQKNATSGPDGMRTVTVRLPEDGFSIMMTTMHEWLDLTPTSLKGSNTIRTKMRSSSPSSSRLMPRPVSVRLSR
jgi:hypothetical protein